MFARNSRFDNALLFSRFDSSHPLSTAALRPFMLDDRLWRSAEHYYQANKFVDANLRERIAGVATAQEAHKRGNRWLQRKRPDFVNIRPVLMTRALYSLVQQHDDVRAYLLGSDQRLVAETSQYQPYWGIGRDQRGENQLGKIWMNIRSRLRQKEGLEPH